MVLLISFIAKLWSQKNKLTENNKETSNLESSSIHLTITHCFRSESRPRYVCLLKTLDLVESRPEAMRTVLLFFFPDGFRPNQWKTAES